MSNVFLNTLRKLLKSKNKELRNVRIMDNVNRSKRNPILPVLRVRMDMDEMRKEAVVTVADCFGGHPTSPSMGIETNPNNSATVVTIDHGDVDATCELAEAMVRGRMIATATTPKKYPSQVMHRIERLHFNPEDERGLRKLLRKYEIRNMTRKERLRRLGYGART